jgi:hypothetical protein
MSTYTFFCVDAPRTELSVVSVLKNATSSTPDHIEIRKDNIGLLPANDSVTIVFSAFAGIPYYIYIPCKRVNTAFPRYEIIKDKIRIFNTVNKKIVSNISIDCQRALVACVYDGIYDHVGICNPVVHMQSIGHAKWDFDCIDACIGLVPLVPSAPVKFINARLLVKSNTGEVHWVLSKGMCDDVDVPTRNLVNVMRGDVLKGVWTISHLYSDDGTEVYACPELLMHKILGPW